MALNLFYFHPIREEPSKQCELTVIIPTVIILDERRRLRYPRGNLILLPLVANRFHSNNRETGPQPQRSNIHAGHMCESISGPAFH